MRSDVRDALGARAQRADMPMSTHITEGLRAVPARVDAALAEGEPPRRGRWCPEEQVSASRTATAAVEPGHAPRRGECGGADRVTERADTVPYRSKVADLELALALVDQALEERVP